MRRERTARIRPGSKHNHGPEAAQLCEVIGPILDLGVKYRPKQVVGPYPLVEGIDQAGYVGLVVGACLAENGNTADPATWSVTISVIAISCGKG